MYWLSKVKRFFGHAIQVKRTCKTRLVLNYLSLEQQIIPKMKRIPYLIPLFFVIACTEKEKTMFVALDTDETGIEFINPIDNNDSINILNYIYYYNGGGVGAGDFNNDGLVDLFFAGNNSDDALYINKGDWAFEEVSEEAGIAYQGWSTGVSVADINADGWLDIYVSRAGGFSDPGKRKNVLYINNRDGTFTDQAAQYGLDDDSYSTHAAFFDFDRDGDLDLYLMNHGNRKDRINSPVPLTMSGNAESNDRLYENKGSFFEDVTVAAELLSEGYGLGLVIHDFNSDGWPDIYVANDFVFSDLLYINDQDGTFTERAGEYLPHQSYNAMGSDIGDFNNDGYMDLVTLDMLPEGSLRQKTIMGAMNYYKFDLIIKGGYEPQYMRNMVYEGNADGFNEIGRMLGVHATDWSWAPLLADFDNDSNLDLFVANGYYKDITDRDFIMFSSQSSMFRNPQEADSIIMAELRKLPETPKPNYMFQGLGKNRFTDVSEEWLGLDPTFSNGAIYADLDNDGDLDIITNNINQPAGIHQNNSSGSGHFLNVVLRDTVKNAAGIGAVIRLFADGETLTRNHFPYRGFMGSTHAPIHFGLGEMDDIDSVEVTWPDQVVTTYYDLKVDTLHHLLKSRGFPKKKVSLNDRTVTRVALDDLDFIHKEDYMVDFNRQPLLMDMLSREGPALAVGDLNADGLQDVFVGGAKGQASRVYYQQEDGFRSIELEDEAKYEDVSAEILDLNGDGINDIFVATGGYTDLEDRIYLGKREGVPDKPMLLPENVNTGAALAIADFDQDEDPDVFIGGRFTPGKYPMRPISSLLINHQGQFKMANGWPKRLGMITDATWADLNADGAPELIVARDWEPLAIMENVDGRLLNAIDIGESGLWHTIEVSDIDGDEDMDIIAGNFGLNNDYHVSGETPMEMFFADFDQNGSIDPVITKYFKDGKYPIHLRDALINQMPIIKNRIQTYASYAQLPLERLFSSEELEMATRYEITELRSGIFINQDSAFAFEPFPNRVQYGPAQDIEVADLNQDGRKDVVIVGNDFDLEVLGGRQDALDAVILLQDGQGIFTVGTTVNLENARNVRRLTTPSGDFWLVGQNNGRLRILDIEGL